MRTPRLTLRELTDADLDDLAGLLGDPQVMRYYRRPKTRDEARGWLERNRCLYRERGFGLWAVALTATGEFLGECGLTVQRIDDVEEIEIGYHLRTAHQGRGYATEAAAACRDLARDRFGLTRLVAIIDPANRPSQALAERIGLRREKRTHVHGGENLIYTVNLRP